MAKLFISFLGIGPDGEGYKSLKYYYNNEPCGRQTRFVQRAEIEAIGPKTFDRIIIICTNESFTKYFLALKNELADELGIDPAKIQYEKISSGLKPENQWQLFSLVTRIISDKDRVVFDFTHGFRLLPVIMSAAIHFIVKSKLGMVLDHVFYGLEENLSEGMIVDMKNFYGINEWAEAVGQLVDNADTSKLATLAARKTGEDFFSGLKDKSLIQSLNYMTRVIKDIDVNAVSASCGKTIDIIQGIKKSASPEEQELMDLILSKFSSLVLKGDGSGFYDGPYFEIQLNFAEMLAKHGLYMQAFTVMRELIASIGMVGVTGKYKGKKIDSNDGRRYRKRFGEIFVNLCQFPKDEWKYLDPDKKQDISKETLKDFEVILPFYESLEEKGVAAVLQGFVKKMVDVRNGFDHAWTGKAGSDSDITEVANNAFEKTGQVLEQLKQYQII